MSVVVKSLVSDGEQRLTRTWSIAALSYATRMFSGSLPWVCLDT